MIDGIRVLYLGVVILGLLVNVAELRQARWVRRELLREGINGLRIVAATHFARESWFRTSVQVCFLIIATISVSLPRGLFSDLGRDYLGWIAFSQFVHIVAAGLLTVKALLSRQTRLQMADAIHE